MTPEESHASLAAFATRAEIKRTESATLRDPSTALVIICPDCGKNVAFRGRCPKCGGASWIPAGEHGGYVQRMRGRGLRIAEGHIAPDL